MKYNSNSVIVCTELSGNFLSLSSEQWRRSVVTLAREGASGRSGVGLVIERSLVRFPTGALSSKLGQLSLPSLRGR